MMDAWCVAGQSCLGAVVPLLCAVAMQVRWLCASVVACILMHDVMITVVVVLWCAAVCCVQMQWVLGKAAWVDALFVDVMAEDI